MKLAEPGYTVTPKEPVVGNPATGFPDAAGALPDAVWLLFACGAVLITLALG